MVLIGQKKNWEILSHYIDQFHKNNQNTFNVFFYKNKSISCNYLARKVINELGLHYVTIDCIVVRTISIFKNKIAGLSYKSILFLKNYDRLRKNIKEYFENFITKDHKNKNIFRIIKSVIIITTNSKTTITKISKIEIIMENYSFDELMQITYHLIEKFNYNRNQLNPYSLLNRYGKIAPSPKYIERLLMLYSRYNDIIKITRIKELDFHSYLKIQLLIWNKLTILDMCYLLILQNKNNMERNRLFIFNLLENNSQLKKYIIKYLGLNYYVVINQNRIKLTLKGQKVVNNIIKNKTIQLKIDKLDFQLEEKNHY